MVQNLFEGNIYEYKLNGDIEIGIFFCRSVKRKNIYIIPLDEKAIGTCQELTTLNRLKYAIISNIKEVHINSIIKPFYIRGKPAAISIKEHVDCFTKLVNIRLTSENINVNSSIPSTLTRQDVSKYFEDSMKFLNWQKDKFNLSFNTHHSILVYERGIYWVNLGHNIGTEINKQRTCIIWKKLLNKHNSQLNSYIVIPLTTQTSGSRYYHNIPITIDGIMYYARVSDMKRVHQNRIIKPRSSHNNSVHFITKDEREEIKQAILDFYIF